MKRYAPIVVALVLPLTTTAFVLAHVARNRSGGRDRIVLTQREATVEPRSADDSAATVSLTWTDPAVDVWPDREQLQAIGFDVSVPPESTDAERHYRRRLAREAYVAFELDGPAWRDVVAARERDERTREPGQAPDNVPFRGRVDLASRLVPVDIALDGESLAARYPNGRTHLITAAVVAIERRAPLNEKPYLSGRITQVMPRRISVPNDLATQLPMSRFDRNQPAFTVSVRYGKLFEPWVVNP